MLPKLKKCRRGVSPIIATIMLLALTLGAAGMIAGVIFNINVIELPDYLESPFMTSQVNFTSDFTFADTDNDTLIDTIIFHIINDAFSSNISIYDFDIMLPTGELVDEIIPWVIVYHSENAIWYNEYLGQPMEGYLVKSGVSAYFNVTCENLEGSIGELGLGESFYVIMNYRYLLQAGGRFAIENSFYQSSLITIT